MEIIGLAALGLTFAVFLLVVFVGLCVAAVRFFRRPPAPQPSLVSFAPVAPRYEPPPVPEANLVSMLRAHKQASDEEHEIRMAKQTLDGLTRWASTPDPPLPPPQPPNS